MRKRSPRILIVDDDAAIAEMLARSLSRRGYRTEAASSADDALARCGRTRYDAALLDLVMPGRDGATLAAELKRRTPDMTLALLTGYTRSPLITKARRAGATVFTKPVVIQELVDYLEAEIR